MGKYVVLLTDLTFLGKLGMYSRLAFEHRDIEWHRDVNVIIAIYDYKWLIICLHHYCIVHNMIFLFMCRMHNKNTQGPLSVESKQTKANQSKPKQKKPNHHTRVYLMG